MAVSEELLVRLTVDSKGAVSGVEMLEKGLKDYTKQAKTAEKTSKDLGMSYDQLALTITGINQALELGAKAFNAIAGPIKKSIDAFLQQEAAQTKLVNTLKVLGEFTPEVAKDFEEFASSLQQVTTVGDETSLELISIAKSMGLTNKMTKQLIKSSADLAAAQGKGLNEAFRQLLKTTGGMAGELAEVLPAVKELTSEELKAGKAIELVGKQFEGFATIQAQTLQGGLQQVKNAFGDLLEEIGKVIVTIVDLPDMTKVLKDSIVSLQEAVKDIGQDFERLKNAMSAIDWDNVAKSVRNLTIAFIGLFAAIQVGKFLAFTRAVGGLSAIKDVIPLVQLFATQLAATKIGATVAALAGMAKVFILIAAKVIIVVAAIGALVVAIDLIARNLERLPELWDLFYEAGRWAIIQLLQLFNKATDIYLKSILFISEKVKVLGLASQESIDRINQNIRENNDALKDLEGQASKTGERVREMSKAVDLGLLGEGINFVKGLFEDIAKTSKETSDNTKNLPGDLALTKQQLMAIASIKEQNRKLDFEIETIGLNQLEILDKQLEFQKASVDLAREKLKEEGKWSKEADAALDSQIAKLEIITQKRKEAAGAGAGGIGGELTQFAGVLDNLPGVAGQIQGAIGGLQKVVDGLQKMVDAIPKLLNSIANLIESITNLPLEIAKGVTRIVDSLIDFVKNIGPNLIQMVDEILVALIEGLLIELPDAILQALVTLPEMIVKFIEERLPHFVEKLVVGLITAMPKIMIGMVVALVKGAPKIAMALIRVMIIELPKAILNGLIEAFKMLGDLILGVFEGFSFENITEEVQKMGDSITRAASELFQVIDLEAEARGLDIADRIQGAVSFSVDILGRLFEQFLAALKSVWLWVWDNVLSPFFDILRSIWLWIYDNVAEFGGKIWEGLKAAISGAWEFIKEMGSRIWEGFSALWESIKTLGANIWDGLVKAAGTAGETIKGWGMKIWEGLKSIAGATTGFLSSLGGYIWDGLKNAADSGIEALKNLGGSIADGFIKAVTDAAGHIGDEISKGVQQGGGILQAPGEWLGDRLGVGEGFEISFSKGGIVGGSAAVPGDSILNDKILALLSPGEAVIPRSLMQDPIFGEIIKQILGVGSNIARFNTGGMVSDTGMTASVSTGEFSTPSRPMGNNGSISSNIARMINGGPAQVNNSYEFNVEMKIDASATKLDESYVRTRLIPEFKDELRKSSQRGDYIINSKGVRT